MIRIFSYGGGVQSTAVLVLAARNKVDYEKFIFANVGEESENPRTLAYYREYAEPFAEEHNITLREVWRRKADGSRETLMSRIRSTESSIPLPARMPDSGAPGNRVCTQDFKIRVVDKVVLDIVKRRLGIDTYAEAKRQLVEREQPVIVGLGISVDEIHRAKTKTRKGEEWKHKEYPLIDLGMRRIDCINIIRDAGLPVPPKSSCFFCPYHTNIAWRNLKRTEPELFEKAVALEQLLIKRRAMLGKGPVYLTRYGKPLNEVFRGNQLAFFDDDNELNNLDNCESGYCMV